jgi:hypothetical protein
VNKLDELIVTNRMSRPHGHDGTVTAQGRSPILPHRHLTALTAATSASS